MDLAALGSLIAQMCGRGVDKIDCSYSGEIASADTALNVLTSEVLAGFFAHFTETRVNGVNAKIVARQHHINVNEARTMGRHHGSSIAITAAGDYRR